MTSPGRVRNYTDSHFSRGNLCPHCGGQEIFESGMRQVLAPGFLRLIGMNDYQARMAGRVCQVGAGARAVPRPQRV